MAIKLLALTTVGYATGWSSRSEDQTTGQGLLKNNIWKWAGSVVSDAPEIIEVPLLQVYPNPASDWVFIELENAGLETLPFTLTDLNGRIVFSGQLVDKKLNVQNLTSGIYFLKIQAKKGLVAQKIVRQ